MRSAPLRLNGLKTLVITNVCEVKPQSRRVRRVAPRETNHSLPTPYSEEPNWLFAELCGRVQAENMASVHLRLCGWSEDSGSPQRQKDTEISDSSSPIPISEEPKKLMAHQMLFRAGLAKVCRPSPIKQLKTNLPARRRRRCNWTNHCSSSSIYASLARFP